MFMRQSESAPSSSSNAGGKYWLWNALVPRFSLSYNGSPSDPQSSRVANPGPSTPVTSVAHGREPNPTHELTMHVLQPGSSSQMVPSSQPQAQPQTHLSQHLQNQQHPHSQHPQSLQAYHPQTYTWGHFPTRPTSSVSTTSAVGGNLEIDLELAQRSRGYPVDIGASSGANTDREWATVTGEEGMDGVNEAGVFSGNHQSSFFWTGALFLNRTAWCAFRAHIENMLGTGNLLLRRVCEVCGWKGK